MCMLTSWLTRFNAPFAESDPVSRAAVRLLVLATPLTMFSVPASLRSAVPEPADWAGALFRNLPTFEISFRILTFLSWPSVTLKFSVPFSVLVRASPDARAKRRSEFGRQTSVERIFHGAERGKQGVVSTPANFILTAHCGVAGRRSAVSVPFALPPKTLALRGESVATPPFNWHFVLTLVSTMFCAFSAAVVREAFARLAVPE